MEFRRKTERKRSSGGTGGSLHLSLCTHYCNVTEFVFYFNMQEFVLWRFTSFVTVILVADWDQVTVGLSWAPQVLPFHSFPNHVKKQKTKNQPTPCSGDAEGKTLGQFLAVVPLAWLDANTVGNGKIMTSPLTQWLVLLEDCVLLENTGSYMRRLISNSSVCSIQRPIQEMFILFKRESSFLTFETVWQKPCWLKVHF